MPTKQSVRQMKFSKENIKVYRIGLNIRTDADLIEQLDKQQSKQGFIKQALREYIVNHSNEPHKPIE